MRTKDGEPFVNEQPLGVQNPAGAGELVAYAPNLQGRGGRGVL